MAAKDHLRNLAPSMIHAGLVTAGLAFSGLSIAAARVVMARYFAEPSAVGEISAGLAVVLLAIPLADFGVARLIVQQDATEGFHTRSWAPASMRVVSFATVLTSGFLVAIVLLLGAASTARTVAALLPLLMLGVICGISAALEQVAGRFSVIALIRSVPGLAVLVAVVFAALVGLDVIGTAYAIGATSAIAAILLLVRLVPWSHRTAAGLAVTPGQIASSAWPLAVASLSYAAYYQIDQVLLRFQIGAGATGFYALAVTVLGAAYLPLAAAFVDVFQHRILQLARDGISGYRLLLRSGTVAMFAVGSALGAVLFFGAPWIVLYLFGTEYRDTIPLLRILSFAVPLRYSGVIASTILNAKGLIRRKTTIAVMLALFNAIANLALIPIFGAKAAALTTVTTEGLAAVAFVVAAYRGSAKN